MASNSVNLQASVSSLIPAGAKTKLTVNSPQSIRQFKGLPTGLANSLAQDINNIGQAVNTLQQAAQLQPSVNEILITNPSGQVIAAIGNFTYQGVLWVNYLSELHVCNPQKQNDPTGAVFNANLDGSVSIGDNGWFDVHDFFGGNAAWIGTQFDTTVITNAVNNGSGEIRLTVPGHTLITGNTAQVRAMNLYNVGNANGTWQVTVIDASTVDLNGSIYSGPFQAFMPPSGLPTYQPTIDRVLQVIGATSSGGLIELETSIPHTYETGDQVNVPSVPGVPAATAQWIIKVVDATHFTLDNSVFAGAFTGTGTVLRYFAGMLAETIAIGTSFPDYKLRAFADGTLIIKNASIVLESGSSEILLDPTIPAITLTSATSNIQLNAATGEITLSQVGTLAEIVLAASTPSITLYDPTGAVSVTIDANGNITARTISTGISTFTGTATVRNAAGTGVSTFTFVNGVCETYAP